MPEKKRAGGKPLKKKPAAGKKTLNAGVAGKKAKKAKTSRVSVREQMSGARNPYALAEAVMGERYDWAVMEEYDRKHILAKALRRPYGKLFDPVHGSPIYSRAMVAMATGVESQTSSSPGPCGDAPETPWRALAGGAYYIPPPAKPTGRDPVQGCSGDCYFVAAMTSLAWVSPQLFARLAGPNYTYTFWNTETGVPESVTIDNRLPLRGTFPVFARSNTVNETWVSLMERAYGVWKKLPGWDIGEPNLAAETDGNALTALQYIAKGIDRNYGDRSATTAECGHNWTTMLGKIYTLFDPANADCSRITASKTKVPMVAWTYDDVAEAPQGMGVSYSDTTIVAHHAYSVLGLMFTGGKCYIVLHNPWGRTEASASTVAGGSWTLPQAKTYKRGGAPTTLPASRFTIDLTVNDGTFALDTGVFMTHFQTIGWLQ